MSVLVCKSIVSNKNVNIRVSNISFVTNSLVTNNNSISLTYVSM